MNVTDNLPRACNPVVPAALIWVGLIHSCCVIVIGTLGNALALWCVATCTKTGRRMKVLLFSVFLPVLVLCLTTRPIIIEWLTAQLKCWSSRISHKVFSITVTVYLTLVKNELTSIIIIIIVRAAAIWAPNKPRLGIPFAVAIVITTCMYPIYLDKMLRTSVSTGASVILDNVISLYIFSIFIAPIVIIPVYYLILKISVQVRATTTMDQATRAMLAVFISNIAFGLPLAIYHLTGKPTIYKYAISEVIFSTHFVVGPLVYILFNSDYREKILSSVRKVILNTAYPPNGAHRLV